MASDYHAIPDGPAPTKRELLAALAASRDEVVGLVRSMDRVRLEEGRYENGWNGRQILAHIASIEWSYPRLIDIARTPPAPVEQAPPTRTMKGGNDAYNDRQVAKREGMTVAALLAEFGGGRGRPARHRLPPDRGGPRAGPRTRYRRHDPPWLIGTRGARWTA